jgi:hypothetical protein
VRYRAAALQAAHTLGVGGEEIDAVVQDYVDQSLAHTLEGVARSTYAAMLAPQAAVTAP